MQLSELCDMHLSGVDCIIKWWILAFNFRPQNKFKIALKVKCSEFLLIYRSTRDILICAVRSKPYKVNLLLDASSENTKIAVQVNCH